MLDFTRLSAESNTDITFVAGRSSIEELDHVQDFSIITMEGRIIFRSFGQICTIIVRTDHRDTQAEMSV